MRLTRAARRRAAAAPRGQLDLLFTPAPPMAPAPPAPPHPPPRAMGVSGTGAALFGLTEALQPAAKPRAPHPAPKRLVDRAGPDFYPTPPWATHALIDNEPFVGAIWECACGDVRMSRVLALTGNPVFSSDLHDYGYGEAGIDFLRSARPAANIVTNPPFNLAEEFVLQALRLAERKVAMLVRLAFLESARRWETLFARTPPSRTWVCSERITFYPGGIQTAGSGPGAHAWLVWDKAHAGPPELRWLRPGYKARYRQGDAAGGGEAGVLAAPTPFLGGPQPCEADAEPAPPKPPTIRAVARPTVRLALLESCRDEHGEPRPALLIPGRAAPAVFDSVAEALVMKRILEAGGG